jgi:hypothetical protein
MYLHFLAMTVVMGGLLRDHNGHKTWVAWVFTVWCVSSDLRSVSISDADDELLATGAGPLVPPFLLCLGPVLLVRARHTPPPALLR